MRGYLQRCREITNFPKGQIIKPDHTPELFKWEYRDYWKFIAVSKVSEVET